MFYKLKTINYKLNEGMSYVELIVVLSIMSIMSAVVIFNYQDFQSKVEIKSLANKVALKIVEAQKNASAGKLPLEPFISPTKTYSENWKPAYGIYFNLGGNGNNIAFDNFADLNNDGMCNTFDIINDPMDSCIGKSANSGRDYITSININPKYQISNLVVICSDGSEIPANDSNLSITFTRSNPGATIYTPSNVGNCPISFTKISFESSSNNSIKSNIEVHSSGMIKINN